MGAAGSGEGQALGTESDQTKEVQAEEEEDEGRGMQWNDTDHTPQLPEGGVFTVETLRRWDGVELPMCLGICGKVVDVSSSDNFRPGFGYGKLWAGQDATYSMATNSLKPEMVANFDFKVEELEEGQFDSLVGWYKHFTGKYPTRGTLKEYEGWDFSAVEKAAAEM
mmetsp:Transcript_27509/g.69069  ORF Transcript_27509/g.69069 Transcript_27509/m.69069 type:complete len:166 (-) Transcript_27509:119-616(-)